MNESIEVTDLGLAAFLSARGYLVLRLEGRPGRRTFVFPEAARDDCRACFAGAPVEARAYYESLRSLKALVHNAELMR